MLGSQVLEVAIGIILLFLFMSLICTAIVEVIEGLLKHRAMDLERGIREMFNDPDGQFTKKFFEHPLIYGLFSGEYQLRTSSMTGAKRGRMDLAGRRRLPSYIPSGHFAAALLDIVARGSQTDGQFDTSAPTIEGLRKTIGNIQNPKLQRAVIVALDEAGDDLSKAKASLEAWYDGTMDRVSGWYKRRTQWILFWIALLAAAVLNIDAITVAKRLANDSNLQQAALSEAEVLFSRAQETRPTEPAAPGDAATPDKTNDHNVVTGRNTGLAELSDEGYPKLIERMEAIGYPMGWSPPAQCPADVGNTAAIPCTMDSVILSWTIFPILAGWLITALAVMLGAPFWFDVLNKFMVIRSTVKPREKSQEEGSEDRRPSPPSSRPVGSA